MCITSISARLGGWLPKLTRARARGDAREPPNPCQREFAECCEAFSGAKGGSRSGMSKKLTSRRRPIEFRTCVGDLWIGALSLCGYGRRKGL